jgi:hypothetical protein
VASQDIACVAHVHSTYSDGTATVPEIAAAARRAGADAVLLTDHDSLGARRAGWEGWNDGVLVLVGLEVSPPGGHLLAFGVDREIQHAGRSEAQLAEAVADAGGLAFPAHPFSAGSRMSRRIGRPDPWRTLATTPVTGLELWNVGTEGAERCRTPVELLRFMRRPEDAVDSPPAENLAAWDTPCQTRRLVAADGWTLAARVPDRAELRLVCDGAEVARGEGRQLEYATTSRGVFRVEAWRQNRVWILSNPIYLR